MGSSPSAPPGPPSVSRPSGSTCDVYLYHDGNYSGLEQNYSSSTPDLTNPSQPFNRNYATWQKTNADENCLITAYTCPTYGTHGNCDYVMIRQGEDNIYNNPGGHGATGRNFNDDYDSIRIQRVPSAAGDEIEYHINTIAQRPTNPSNPAANIGNNTEVYYNQTQKFIPCPGAGKVYFNSKSGIKCIYSKRDEGQIQALHDGIAGGAKSNQAAMLSHVRGEFCNVRDNIWKNAGGGVMCASYTTNQNLAKQYCEVGDRIRTDPNCSSSEQSLGTTGYSQVATAYCEANPDEDWCACYNVWKGKCPDDATTGVAGCQETENYVKLRNETPVDQRSVWDGQRKCGSICSGNRFLPAENQAGCKSTIQICNQDINAEGITDSKIDAVCNLNADGDSGTKNGGGGGSDTKTLEPPSLTNFQTNPQAYFPQSIEGLKTDQRQQIGAGAVGVMALGCMMLVLLLILSSGGGGGAVKRRYT